MGHDARPGWTGPRTCRSRSSRSAPTSRTSRGRVPVLGRLRRRLRGPREEDHPGRRRAAAHGGRQFAVLGDGETCTGDPARRSGNEFLFQQLAQQNVEMLNEAGAPRSSSTCAHCFNTLKNEYPQLGGSYEVVHHTQLLNRLVREERLDPGRPDAPQPDATRPRHRHLPRPLLPRPAQRGLRAAARALGALPGVTSRRCRATATGRSAAAPAARGCGWRRSSAPGSTPTAPRRRSPPARRSRSAARSAG